MARVPFKLRSGNTGIIDPDAEVKKTPWWKFGEKRKVRKMNKEAKKKYGQ